MLRHSPETEITVVSEPDPRNYETAMKIFSEREFKGRKLKLPPNETDLKRLLEDYPLDVAFIVTPHVLHLDQATACLEAGLDVLLEKPMVMSEAEGRRLIAVRQRSGRCMVIGFPGALSPTIREAVRMVREGEIGQLVSISADIWQNWGDLSHGTWRQNPPISGGGFLFDTGAHMLNTVLDLAGEEFVEVGAWVQDYGRPVETMAVVIGRLASGAMVTLHGCGETIPTWASKIHVFGKQAILSTDAWGRFLNVQKAGEDSFTAVSVPASTGVWEQFLAIRAGKIDNPCTAEAGLRSIRLYEAIQESAARGGEIVKLA
jgi:predicted dehydrogenase